MYLEREQFDGQLEQGDICVSIPVPIVTADTQVVLKNIPTLVDFSQIGNAEIMTFAVTPVMRPVMVLSQSCDLADAEGDAAGRVLIAPITDEEDSAFLATYRENIKKAATPETLVKALTPLKSGQQPSKEVKALTEHVAKRKLEILTRIWKGEYTGVVPVQAISLGPACILPRGICHFSGALSVPSSWIPMLKSKRVAQLDDTWRSVLQEALRDWLGRFAYPGDLDDRVRVGLDVGSRADTEPVKGPSE